MALTPEDVVNKRFQPTKFREGYDQDEVDDFLDEIVVEFRRLNQENDDLRKQLGQTKDGATKDGESAVASTSTPIVESVPEADAESDKAGSKTGKAKSTKAEAKTGTGEDEAAAGAVAADDAAAETTSEDQAAADKDAAAEKTVDADETAADDKAAVATGETPSAPDATSESAAGVLAMAQRLHDEYVNAGVEQRDKIIADAKDEANGLVSDAEDKSRKTLGALEQQRSVLERKVEQLKVFERDYRSRMKAYIEGQLRDLESKASVVPADAEETAEA